MRNVVAPALLAMTVLTGCSSSEPTMPAAEKVRPVLSVLAQASLPAADSFVGTIQPKVSNQLAFRVGGTLVSRPTEIGQLVAAGEVLANLDATTLSLAVQSAEASLTSAQAQFVNAISTQARLESLLETNNATPADVEQGQQQARAAEAALLQAQASLDRAKEQLGYTRIVANFNGVVTAVGADTGSVVSAGQMILTVADPDQRDLVIDVPESVVDQLQIGVTFDIAAQLDPSITVKGTLREIAPQADASTRTWRVRIALDAQPAGFWLGTTATASLKTDAAKQVWVPQSAILSDGAKTSVWVVDTASQTVARREVSVGEANDGRVPLLAGVAAGERVVTAGVTLLTDGQHVRFEGEQAQ